MDRREFVSGAGAVLLNGDLVLGGAAAAATQPNDVITAAYYFGNFHVDARNEQAHGPRWTEWNLVKAARPRFANHQQPRVPQWGYGDESRPEVFRQKIAAAQRNGVNALLFDWYWYEDGPFLNGALESGYLQAPNREDVRFALMWANHDWIDLHPAKLDSPGKLQFHGGISRTAFDAMCERVVELFRQPSYLKLEGKPYFSIYELFRFAEGMGGLAQAGQALDALRARARAAGFSGVHLNAVTWGVKLLPGEAKVTNLPELLRQLQIDSTTSYVWIHHARLADTVTTEYQDVRRQYETYRDRASAELGCTYLPNVTVGWDATPRTCQTDNFRVSSYPFTSVVVNNTPAAFEEALRSAKEFALDRLPAGRRLVTLNSWNEWTEGSYLEPDTARGERLPRGGPEGVWIEVSGLSSPSHRPSTCRVVATQNSLEWQYAPMKTTAAKRRPSQAVPEKQVPAKRPRVADARLSSLLEAAADVFIAEGFDKASLQEIAKRAGASKATLYGRYSNKEQLFIAVLQHRMRIITDTMALGEIDNAAPLEMCLTQFGTGLLTTALSDAQIELIRTISTVSSRFPQLGEQFFELGTAYGLRTLSSYLRARQERGELATDESSDLMAQQFVTLLVDSYLYRKLLGVAGRQSPRERAAQVARAVRMFLRCYAVTPTARTTVRSKR